MQVLVTSPRLPAGLLTFAAWEALRTADVIVCPDLDDPTARAVRAAGFEVAAAPLPGADAEHTANPGAVWLAPTGDVEWAHRLATGLVAGDVDGIDVVFASYDPPGARLLDLVDVMDRLRRECPWTQQQTHNSLTRYLLEETYEVLEALDDGADDDLREELGDLMMQVVFHARIAQDEPDGWSVDDVAEVIVAKLVNRNPHVFGDATAADAAEVDANWEAIKATEKQRSSPLDGIARELPALAYADKVLERLARSGGGSVPEGDDVGARLLRLVQEARTDGTDPEQALRLAVRRLFG